ncbi:hypothetical protein L873DRAFT_1836286 [Choiromyces venosus 120613-1]|uniref:Amidohydrolase 3 domain-containing protein n=1 Tax=Choiromyces venosus 120613-1 TaxID=1336337 RepID=A0A3N4JVF0_9PEZI|nr:hypothetical protein L873DRAFT_1836286 [Choiromyces venosus 120613-1]
MPLLSAFAIKATCVLLLSLVIWQIEVFRASIVFECYQRVDTLSPTNNDSFTCILASTRSRKIIRLTNHSNNAFFRLLHGRVGVGYAMPGLWDGHGHVLQYGEMLRSVKLYGVESIDEVKTRIKEYLKENPTHGTKEKWIRGIGWDQKNFGGVMPVAAQLSQDPELAGLYIMLDRVDAHCVWVSEPVLNLLPNPFPNIPGGEVITDPGVGVFCDNAMDPVYNVWPRPGREEKIEFLEDAMKSLHSVGIVGVHDAGVVPADARIFHDVALVDRLTLRIYAMLECPVRNTFCEHEARSVIGHVAYGTLAVRSVKLFADGALGSWGAALLSPYSDKPNATGSMLIEEEELYPVVKAWAAIGIQVNIHAIGDRANRAAITAFEKALKSFCPDQETCDLRSLQAKRRFRIEHTQIVSPEDQERMVKMGIVPSIQPTHATSDMAYALSRLGPERLASSAYRMKSFYDAGLPVILGSDFPVEPPSPFAGIYAAMTRRSPEDGSSGNKTCPECGWYPEEKLALREALAGFGTHVAWGGFMEDEGVGQLVSGGWADWIVLDRDIWAASPEEIRDVKVLETWVGGRRVWPAENS